MVLKSSSCKFFFTLFVWGSWTFCVRSSKLKVRHVFKRALIGITFCEHNYIFTLKDKFAYFRIVFNFAVKMGIHSWISYQNYKATYDQIVKIFSKNICQASKFLTYPAVKTPIRKFSPWTFQFQNHLCWSSCRHNGMKIWMFDF